jgi:hypothetical protein
MADPSKRRKPSDIALAENKSWRQGITAARTVKRTLLDERLLLLKLGFPSGHALCEALDKDAAKWAGIEDQMRRDYIKHADDNQLQI